MVFYQTLKNHFILNYTRKVIFMTNKQFLLIAALGLSSVTGNTQAMDQYNRHEYNPAMALLRSPGSRVFKNVSDMNSFENPHRRGQIIQKALPTSPRRLKRKLSDDLVRRAEDVKRQRLNGSSPANTMIRSDLDKMLTQSKEPGKKVRKHSYKDPKKALDQIIVLKEAEERLLDGLAQRATTQQNTILAASLRIEAESSRHSRMRLQETIAQHGYGTRVRQRNLMDMFSQAASTASTATTETASSDSDQPGAAAAAAE